MQTLSKIFAVLLWLSLWLFVGYMLCSCSSAQFYHDAQNPCTLDQYGVPYDSVECQAWKNNFPKEYAKYYERTN